MPKEKTEEKVRIRIYDREAIDGAIVILQRDANSLKGKIHNLGVSILKVWHDAKDDKDTAAWACERLNNLQNASPYHAKSFADWVQAFTNLHWSKENKAWYVNTTEDNRIMGKAFIAARDTPFWAVSPPSAPKPFDLRDTLEKLITRTEKRVDEPKEGDVVDKAALKHLREALKAMEETPAYHAPEKTGEPDF